MQNLLNCRSHIFPRQSEAKIVFTKANIQLELTPHERKMASILSKELGRDPLGDGVKLSVQRMDLQDPSSVQTTVSPIRYSEIGMMLERAKNEMPLDMGGYLTQRGVKVLLSNNVLVTRDNKILLSSRGGHIFTPLNGFVDSSTMEGNPDAELVKKTVMKELAEEYGEFAGSRLEIHSIHLEERPKSIPGSIVVFGSVHLSSTVKEVMHSKESAPDSHENPLLLVIDNTADAISTFLKSAPHLEPMLRAYMARLF